MGTIRTLLALAVVLTHAYGFGVLAGMLAVQLFYMISGYLISFIPNETDNYRQVSVFYKNRALRLFPVYFVVAGLALLVQSAIWASGGVSPVFDTYAMVGNAARAVLTIANITLFFQDWVMFLGSIDGKLQFVSSFTNSDVPLYNGLLVPQAWTLGLELTFYLIAPFIIRKKWLVIALFGASVLLRLYLISIGIGRSDPWSHRFFPTELGLFLLGAMAHQWLWPLVKRLPEAITQRLAIVATAFLAILWLGFPMAPASAVLLGALIGLFALCLPLLFVFQAGRQWDKTVGNLSYPLYIGHMLVISVINQIGLTADAANFWLRNSLIVIASLGFAWALERWIAAPVEQRRARIRQHHPVSSPSIPVKA